MLTFVIGGASCGKSQFAEKVACGSTALNRIYVATMQDQSPESKKRIDKHCAARAEKRFVTLEMPLNLSGARILPDSVVLVECITNLVANEMFSPGGAGVDTVQAVLRGVGVLRTQAKDIVIVSGNVFEDGIEHDPLTQRYANLLGIINRELAARADAVVEVVCGIPLYLKGMPA